MVPTIIEFDKLLRMPNGYAEETMVVFAMDVVITNYLTATNQLTNDIDEKARNYIRKGDVFILCDRTVTNTTDTL